MSKLARSEGTKMVPRIILKTLIIIATLKPNISDASGNSSNTNTPNTPNNSYDLNSTGLYIIIRINSIALINQNITNKLSLKITF